MVKSTTSRAHYVSLYDGKMVQLALCGTKASKWFDAVDEPLCARCERLYRKEIALLQDCEDPLPKKEEPRVNFLQVVGPSIPCANILVPDLREIRNLLMSLRPDGTISLKRQMIDTTVKFIDEHIRAAEARCVDAPPMMTFTPPSE